LSTTHAPAYRSATLWKLSFAACAVMAVLNSISSVAEVVFGSRRIPAWEPAVLEFTSWTIFALLIPFVASFVLRYRARLASILPWLLAQLCAAAVFSLFHVAGMVLLRKLVFSMADSRYLFEVSAAKWLYETPKDGIVYGLTVAVTYGIDFYARYRQRELTATQLEANLANARLEALKQQIQPHFLFNTLNMISSTMHEDLERADHMITRLSDLLRLTVAYHRAQEVRLFTELDLLDAYGEIMRARFEDRMSLEVEVAEDCMDALVPPLLLQPLVENAIKYGIADSEEKGAIEVHIWRDAQRLRCTVADDGPGTEDSLEELLERGVGLSATRERLMSLYESASEFDIRSSSGGGFEVVLSLPYRPAETPIT
jgi:signal transduction histidine kinase